MDTTIELQTEFVVLSAVLKLAGAVGSGGDAKRWIQDGHVRVNGAIDRRRGAKIRPGDVVVVEGDPPLRIHVQAG